MGLIFKNLILALLIGLIAGYVGFEIIRKALINKDQNYEALTAGQKRKGTQGLKHNKFDVRALEVLFETIAAEDKACFKSSLQPCFG